MFGNFPVSTCCSGVAASIRCEPGNLTLTALPLYNTASNNTAAAAAASPALRDLLLNGWVHCRDRKRWDHLGPIMSLIITCSASSNQNSSFHII